MKLARIRELRLTEGYSEEDIAKMCGVTIEQYRKIEEGEIPVILLLGLSAFYGVSLDYLYERTEDKKIHNLPNRPVKSFRCFGLRVNYL